MNRPLLFWQVTVMKFKSRVYIAIIFVLAAAATFALKGYFKTEAIAEAAGVLPVKTAGQPEVLRHPERSEGSQSKADTADLAAIYREAEEFKGQGRFAEAVSSYEKAVAIAPDTAETYLRLGLLYFKLQMPSKAEEFYQKAIDYGLDNPEVYFHLGYIEEVRGALEKALAYYIQAEQKGSGNPELFYNKGNAYARLGKGAEAIIYYKRVVSMDPKHLDAFVNLSTVSFQLNNYPDARFYLDKAVELGYKAPLEYLKELDRRGEAVPRPAI